MRWSFTKRHLAVACVAVLGSPVLASEPLTLRVSPQVSLEPTVLALHLNVERDPDNRAMKVYIESGEYYRSSFVQLDGDAAPRAISTRFLSVPAGSYEVTAILFGPGEKRRATVTRHVDVLSISGQ